jgi:hypothetical protein
MVSGTTSGLVGTKLSLKLKLETWEFMSGMNLKKNLYFFFEFQTELFCTFETSAVS